MSHDPNSPDGRAIKRISRWLLMELENGFHEVILVPAPEPQHSDHKIRVVQYQNAAWYSEFCQQYTSIRGRGPKRYKRPRTYVRRDFTACTLRRMIAGNFSGVQAGRLIEWIDRKRENHRHARRARIDALIYESSGFDDGIRF